MRNSFAHFYIVSLIIDYKLSYFPRLEQQDMSRSTKLKIPQLLAFFDTSSRHHFLIDHHRGNRSHSDWEERDHSDLGVGRIDHDESPRLDVGDIGLGLMLCRQVVRSLAEVETFYHSGLDYNSVDRAVPAVVVPGRQVAWEDKKLNKY